LILDGLNHLANKINRFGSTDCYVGSGHRRSARAVATDAVDDLPVFRYALKFDGGHFQQLVGLQHCVTITNNEYSVAVTYLSVFTVWCNNIFWRVSFAKV